MQILKWQNLQINDFIFSAEDFNIILSVTKKKWQKMRIWNIWVAC